MIDFLLEYIRYNNLSNDSKIINVLSKIPIVKESFVILFEYVIFFGFEL